MNLPKRDEICIFVETSIANKQYNKKIIFNLSLKYLTIINERVE